jgi:hypothetical protein
MSPAGARPERSKQFEFAQLIDTLARRVEAAITPSEDVEAAANTGEQPLYGAYI